MVKAKGESAYMVILIGQMMAITGRCSADVMRVTKFPLCEVCMHVSDCKKKAGQQELMYLLGWSQLLRELIGEEQVMKRGS